MKNEWVDPTGTAGRRSQIGDIEVYFDEQGTGEPVVLLHGGIMDHQSWGNRIPVFSRDFRVISPDTRGHGRSTDTSEPYSYEMFADDVLGLIDSLGLPQVSLVGFSDGGCTSLHFALKHPERVQKLVLIGTPYNTDNYRSGIVDSFKTVQPEAFLAAAGETSVISELAKKSRAATANDDAWRSTWQKLVNTLWTREPNFGLDDLARVSVPTLILHGENEQYIEYAASVRMEEAIPRASLITISDAGHSSAQQVPGLVNDVVLDFLS